MDHLSTADIVKMISDLVILGLFPLGGALVKRVVKSWDARLEAMGNTLKEINQKIDTNVAKTTGLEKTVAVLKFRMTQIDHQQQEE